MQLRIQLRRKRGRPAVLAASPDYQQMLLRGVKVGPKTLR
jgi:hypothetical protein